MPVSSRARAVGFRRLTVILLLLTSTVALLRLGPLAPDDPDPAATRSPGTPGSTENPLPDCTYADASVRLAGYADWARTLVDTRFQLPPDYQPPDLVSTEAAGFPGPFAVRDFLLEDLRAIREAAEAAGNPIDLAAAHRTFEQQATLFDQREAQLGHDEAVKRVARPGHSEHQLGTTVDFKTAGAADVDAKWASTPAGAWTIEHAAEFGFVLSYPRGRQPTTCYLYEPWHFRYFGRQRAEAIVDSGLTVREFLWREQNR
jgi:D-alanyl-D-alanine carboxypeptidase